MSEKLPNVVARQLYISNLFLPINLESMAIKDEFELHHVKNMVLFV